MIQKFSTKLAYQMSNTKNCDAEATAYGLEILFSTMLNAIFIFGIAYMMGFGIEMIVYMCSFGMLRMSAGGYHAKTHFLCFATYVMMSFTGIWIARFIPVHSSVAVMAILLMSSMILIYRFAPVQTPNRPIFPKERLRFRKRSIFLGYAFITVTIILGMSHVWHLALIITVAVFTESLTLIQFKKTILWGKLK